MQRTVSDWPVELSGPQLSELRVQLGARELAKRRTNVVRVHPQYREYVPP